MIRRTAAIVLALALTPAVLNAQTTVLTVSVPSAEVHAGPSTVNPIVGHAARGTELPVLGNLGSWVRVPWSSGQDGIGYVHVTMGRVSATTEVPGRPASTTSITRTLMGEPVGVRTSIASPGRAAPRTLAPASHIVGVGALAVPMTSFGATARAWHGDRLGIQFGVTRDATTSAVAAGRVTSMQFEPGVSYALFDRVGDYVWIRPYVGSAVSFRHQTWRSAEPDVLATVSDNSVGFRVFAGGEMTIAAVPRFGFSADLGYRRLPIAFPGFEADKLSVSIAAHWYIK